LLVLLGIGLLGYVGDLGGSSIWDANEAYYVETPREMVESGDYLNPSFNYEPRFNKPVLSYWIVAGLYQLFGVSVAVERVAITAFALLMVVGAYLLTRTFSSDPRAPLFAALGLLANPRFFMFARRILIDVALGACMTFVLVFFALAERYPQRRRTWLTAMYVSAGLGVLVKGPVAVVLPALVFLIYLASYRELRRIGTMMIPAGAAIVLAIVAPWYVALYVDSGLARISEFFIGENLGRFTSLVGPQSRGPLFYLPVVLTDSFPWSIVLPVAAIAWIRERRASGSTGDIGLRIRMLLFMWIVVIVAFFSLSRTKQDLYIFPIVAAVVALGGDVMARAGVPGMERLARLVRPALVIIGAILVGLGALAIHVFGRAGTPYALNGAWIAALLAGGGGVAVAFLALHRTAAATAVVLAALIAVNWTMVLVVLPDFERYKPVVPMSEAILRHARPDDRLVHYDVALPSMVFYVKRHIDTLFESEGLLDAIRSDRAVLAVLPEDGYESLKADMGRPTCVVERRPTFDAKLREMISQRQPPAVLLVSTRCPP
jgi:4-amino-4-deoxy-L-arabinose transferase-like glycosyltransferase